MQQTAPPAGMFRAAKTQGTWQARVIVALMRRLLRPRIVSAQSADDIRAAFGNGALNYKGGCHIESIRLGDVAGEWIRSPGTQAWGTLLYLHGGGYVACSPRTHRMITCAFARAGFDVFAVDYRLAPEHPYPAGLDDAIAAYSALLQQGVPPSRIALAGDSAGGGLVLATLLRAREQALPAPAAAVLFSPFTDLTASGASVQLNRDRCAMFDSEIVRKAHQLYAPDCDPRDPFVSPLFADLHHLPPLLIHASEDEVLRDDAVELARRAREAGTEAELILRAGVPHVWPILPWMPEAKAAMRESVEFLKARIG